MRALGKVVVIAQARMSSTRLPGKSMASLGESTVIDHVIDRCVRSTHADQVLIATTMDPSDDPLAQHVEQRGIPVFRGSLDDVLGRYAQAAEASHAETIVRITCDCPLIDPLVLDSVIERYAEAPAVDYCSNTLQRTYPIGQDTEVFGRAALDRAHAEATAQHEREHVTPYIYQHPAQFSLRNAPSPEWAVWPDLRLTVDEPVDLELVREIVDRVGADAGLREILELLRREPSLAAINRNVAHRHVAKPSFE